MILSYLLLLELGKSIFCRREARRASTPAIDTARQHRIHRRAARWIVLHLHDTGSR